MCACMRLQFWLWGVCVCVCVCLILFAVCVCVCVCVHAFFSLRCVCVWVHAFLILFVVCVCVCMHVCVVSDFVSDLCVYMLHYVYVMKRTQRHLAVANLLLPRLLYYLHSSQKLQAVATHLHFCSS